MRKTRRASVPPVEAPTAMTPVVAAAERGLLLRGRMASAVRRGALAQVLALVEA